MQVFLMKHLNFLTNVLPSPGLIWTCLFWDFSMVLWEQFSLTSVTRASPRCWKLKIVKHHLSLFIEDFLRFPRSDRATKAADNQPPMLWHSAFKGQRELGNVILSSKSPKVTCFHEYTLEPTGFSLPHCRLVIAVALPRQSALGKLFVT